MENTTPYTTVPQDGLGEEPQPILSMHPKKFALWLIIVSIVMVFASLTSAYIVRKGEGNWLQFNLPSQLWISSIIVVLSSVTMHVSLLMAKRDNLSQLRLFIVLTTLLGLGFMYSQWLSWVELVNMNVYLVGNPSGSFLYVITGVHVIHMVSGVGFLLLVLYRTFRYQVHSKALTAIQMCATYWHFLGALWIYLFLFFLRNHS